MSPLENLYYAAGELAYAIARADGEVQNEERNKFLEILNGELDPAGQQATGEIIFKLMDKRGHFDPAATYEFAMNTIRNNGHYLSPALKERFVNLLEKVAAAYPPVTSEENALLNRFRSDILEINGDPVYYNEA